MKYLVLLLTMCWLATLLITTSCNKQYREQKHTTHITVKKIVDYQIPPVNLSPDDVREMEEFQEADLDELNPVNMEICYAKFNL